jgi:hypothetical protein
MYTRWVWAIQFLNVAPHNQSMFAEIYCMWITWETWLQYVDDILIKWSKNSRQIDQILT